MADLEELAANWREYMSFDSMAAWLTAVESGKWSWIKNTRCKYVTLRIDTRSGAYAVLDRDEKPITVNELEWQYSADCPSPDARSRTQGNQNG